MGKVVHTAVLLSPVAELQWPERLFPTAAKNMATSKSGWIIKNSDNWDSDNREPTVYIELSFIVGQWCCRSSISCYLLDNKVSKRVLPMQGSQATTATKWSTSRNIITTTSSARPLPSTYSRPRLPGIHLHSTLSVCECACATTDLGGWLTVAFFNILSSSPARSDGWRSLRPFLLPAQRAKCSVLENQDTNSTGSPVQDNGHEQHGSYLLGS